MLLIYKKKSWKMQEKIKKLAKKYNKNKIYKYVDNIRKQIYELTAEGLWNKNSHDINKVNKLCHIKKEIRSALQQKKK